MQGSKNGSERAEILDLGRLPLIPSPVQRFWSFSLNWNGKSTAEEEKHSCSVEQGMSAGAALQTTCWEEDL